jgi:hypothetical protein
VLTNPVYAGAYAYGKSRCEIVGKRQVFQDFMPSSRAEL